MDRNLRFIDYKKVIAFGQARKSLWIETTFMYPFDVIDNGQARKSLWIETCFNSASSSLFPGQARKSLWIETPTATLPGHPLRSGS